MMKTIPPTIPNPIFHLSDVAIATGPAAEAAASPGAETCQVQAHEDQPGTHQGRPGQPHAGGDGQAVEQEGKEECQCCYKNH